MTRSLHPQDGQHGLIQNPHGFCGNFKDDLEDQKAEGPLNGNLQRLPVPPELRDRIYQLVLQLPNCLVSEEVAMQGFEKYNKSHPSRQSHTYPLEQKTGSPFDLNLLLVSKATYLEAYPVFYKINTIYFRNTDILFDFLTNIGPARRQCVTHIGFNWIGSNPKLAFRLLKSCGSLKTLRFTLPTSFPQGYETLHEVRGMQNVMRLTKFIFNENYGRTVKQWCTEKDEDITQDDIDNEDEIDMASEKRKPSFIDLRDHMMRPRGKNQTKSLETKMEKVVVLGGGKK